MDGDYLKELSTLLEKPDVQKKSQVVLTQKYDQEVETLTDQARS